MVNNTINIEVAYALPKKQSLLQLTVDEHCTVEQAISISKICLLYPEISLNNIHVGIFSKPAKLCDCLRESDRIEIYRPLLADPKEIRKRRAAQAKAKAKADKTKAIY